MGENSAIEWCDHTFNPWIGCTAVSAGCKNCYAEVEDKRRGWTSGGWGPGRPRRRTAPANWRNPITWNARAAGAAVRPRVFCASLADVFDQEAPDIWRSDLLHLIGQTPNLDWLILTKRPQCARHWFSGAFMPNVWLGVSVEDQETANERIPILLQIPAAVRFVSYEPGLSHVSFVKFLNLVKFDSKREGIWYSPVGTAGPRLDWIIVGGESGPYAREFDVEWARSAIAQCQIAGAACFVKQLGARSITTSPHAEDLSKLIAIKDRKGGDMSEWPKDLRIREFPR